MPHLDQDNPLMISRAIPNYKRNSMFKSRKGRQQIRHDQIPDIIRNPNTINTVANSRKKYPMEIGDDMKTCLPMWAQILKELRLGKETIASKVSKAFPISQRKALFYLDKLEIKGYLKSETKLVAFSTGGSTNCRVFKKIKDLE